MRGVGAKNINIAVFNDASNTVIPGLEKEFVQYANAFAAWCNASGGINGRHIVIDSRDAALFNAAQVTNEACQSDFMAVGGGLALDKPSVAVRTGCGLGQVTGYVVSDAAETAPLQVDTIGFNPRDVAAGYYALLAKQYPAAVKQAAGGSLNNPDTIGEMKRQADAAQAVGWNNVIFQVTPINTSDWTPYIQQLQTKGVKAVWPSDDGGVLAPYLQAVSTVGFKPAFFLLGNQFYNAQTISALQGISQLPPIYVETGWWPLEMASQNPSTEQMIKVLHQYAKGDAVDYDDENAASSWLLWAKAASACGSKLTVSCVLDNSTLKNWTAGGIEAPIQLTLSNQNPQPSPCVAILQAKPSGFVYDKAITRPTQSIWNCNPKNIVKLTAQQTAATSG